MSPVTHIAVGINTNQLTRRAFRPFQQVSKYCTFLEFGSPQTNEVSTPKTVSEYFSCRGAEVLPPM
jgi:hypothetical protein